MTNEIEQGLHEKLCAVVLGEASDEVRVEVEKALAASAELRAERDRIEKTIGLVKDSMAGGESLPPSAASEILADANAQRRRSWYSQPSFRIAMGIAAGIAVIALVGVLGLLARHDGGPEKVPQLAANDLGMKASPSRLGEEASPAPPVEKTEQLAFSKIDSATPISQDSIASSFEAKSSPAGSTQSVSHAVAGEPAVTVSSLDQIDARGGAAAVERKTDADRTSKEEQARLQGLGYAGLGVADNTAAPQAFGGRVYGLNKALPSRGVYTWRDPSAVPGVSPSGPASGGPTSRSDDFFLAAGKAKDGPGAFGDLRAEASGDQRKERLRKLGYTDDEGDAKTVLGRDLSVIDQLRRLDPPDRDRWIEEECRRIVTNCRRFPNEKPRDMFFRFYGDNPFELAALDPLSTFSVDVDTASYALARRYLNEGHIPEKSQVRTEEFVNYFKADVPAPTKGVFAIHTDLTPSRFSGDKVRSMLRVVVRGKDVTKQDRKPLNLTFVIDVSGSMREQNRLEMVKYAIRLLTTELGGGDNIAIVAFSNDARTVLPMTSVRNRSAIEAALFPLEPENSTNSESGLKLGYSIALANINPEAQNRVVFLSDGVANVGETDPAKLSEFVKPIREKGVYLNTIGVGMNNHNDTLLEQLADKGDGVCSYIDTADEAKKVIVDGFTGTFETIARDVKVQVEFDPAQVERYRLLGYENRAIADKDFRNDKIDAGEVGAGHQVTALFEIERTAGSSEKPLATVRLRWKAPRNVNAPTANEEATEIAQPVLASQQTSFEGAGHGYRRAVIVAQFAEFLRRSVHARGESLDDLIVEAEKLEKETHDPEVGELVVLLHKSKQLILNALPGCDDLCQAIDAVRRNALLRCEHEMLAKELDGKLVADLEKQNADLEQRIRELLRRKLEEKVK